MHQKDINIQGILIIFMCYIKGFLDFKRLYKNLRCFHIFIIYNQPKQFSFSFLVLQFATYNSVHFDKSELIEIL